MSASAPYYVVLDSNVWVAERLLQTSMGSAFLYALAGSGALIGLPQVVEMEVNRVLADQGEKAVREMQKSAALLRQLSEQQLTYLAPTPLAISEGIAHRWDQLGGLLKRIPFTHEQAMAALERITATLPPCGENNEQFRDCCIWVSAVELSAECVVHLVTNDSAFYENRDRSRGLASPLREELARSGRDVRIYPNLTEFIEAMDKTVATLDNDAIGAAIVQALTPIAHEIAAGSRGEQFVLGPASRLRIKGYATPKPSVVAVSFEVSFALKRTEIENGEERQIDAKLRIGGACSYDPNRHEVSEIEVNEWSKNLSGYEGRGFSGTMWADPKSRDRQFGQGRVRLIE